MSRSYDYYEVLGLEPNASAADIKSAYRYYVKKYHPDQNRNDKYAEQKFREVQEAYDVLKDFKKRAAYDRLRSEQASAENKADSDDTTTSRNNSENSNQKKADNFADKSSTSPIMTPRGKKFFGWAVAACFLAIVVGSKNPSPSTNLANQYKAPSIAGNSINSSIANVGDKADSAEIAPTMPYSPEVSADQMVEGARLCTQYFPVEERKNGIPTHLLAAVATVESGRWHPDLGLNVPWPWTIKVSGKRYYFSSKREAITQTQRLLREGYTNIDVGCMQANLEKNIIAFKDLNDAFDPALNVANAASNMHDNYLQYGDWIKASAAYHSGNLVEQQQYLKAIESQWNQIVGKVSAARATGTPLKSAKKKP